jgi:hypothetical protein
LLTERVTALGATMAASSIQPPASRPRHCTLTSPRKGSSRSLEPRRRCSPLGKRGVEGPALPTAMPQIEIEQTRRWRDDDSCFLIEGVGE